MIDMDTGGDHILPQTRDDIKPISFQHINQTPESPSRVKTDKVRLSTKIQSKDIGTRQC